MPVVPCCLCAAEFDAYTILARELPNIEAIAEGKGHNLDFPEEPSIKFACISGLIHMSLRNWATYKNCFTWLTIKCAEEPEWIQSFVLDVIKVLSRSDRKKGAMYMENLNQMKEASRFINDYVAALTAGKSNASFIPVATAIRSLTLPPAR